jgi:hypothetical protein
MTPMSPQPRRVMSDFQARLDALADEYLTIGCPCRFPRFRAIVARDTSGISEGSFTSEDQRGLIRAFERKVTVVEQQPLEELDRISPGMWRGKCGVCGSDLRRAYNEYSPGGYIDWLIIKRKPGLFDLGASVEKNRTFRCRPFVAPGPEMPGMARASRAFPFMEEDAWFEWMRARA